MYGTGDHPDTKDEKSERWQADGKQRTVTCQCYRENARGSGSTCQEDRREILNEPYTEVLEFKENSEASIFKYKNY